jgi:hypothetical protein
MIQLQQTPSPGQLMSSQLGSSLQSLLQNLVAQKMKDIPAQRSAQALRQEGMPESWAHLPQRGLAEMMKSALESRKLEEQQRAASVNRQQPGEQVATQEGVPGQDMAKQGQNIQGILQQLQTQQQQLPQQAEQPGAPQTTNEEIEKAVREGNFTDLREMLGSREAPGATFEDYYSGKQKDISDKFDNYEGSVLSNKNLSPIQKDKLLSDLSKKKDLQESKLEKYADRAEKSFAATEPFRTKTRDSAQAAQETLRATTRVLELLKEGNIDNPAFIGLIDSIDPAAKDAFLSGDTQEMKSLLPKFLGTTLKENFKGQINQREFEYVTRGIPSEKLKSEVTRRISLAKKGESELSLVKDRISNNVIEANKGVPPLNLDSIVNSKLDRYRSTIAKKINHHLKSGKVPPTGSYLSDIAWRGLGVARNMVPLIGAGLGAAVGSSFPGVGTALGAGAGSMLGSHLIGEDFPTAAKQAAATVALGGLGKGIGGLLGKLGGGGGAGLAAGEQLASGAGGKIVSPNSWSFVDRAQRWLQSDKLLKAKTVGGVKKLLDQFGRKL